MPVESISMLHITAMPGQTELLGARLSSLTEGSSVLSGCLSSFVAQSDQSRDIWVVSRQWGSQSAMMRHLEDPALDWFFQLLGQRLVKSVEFSVFINAQGCSCS